jgi:hypothetical protein
MLTNIVSANEIETSGGDAQEWEFKCSFDIRAERFCQLDAFGESF